VKEFVSTRRMAANRSLVGIISCIAAYHVDLIVSDNPTACKFVHTRAYGIPGYFLVIRNSVFFLPILTIICVGVV
jgi:hypothetical protein